MAKTREQKKELITKYADKLKDSIGVIVVKQKGGITPNDASKLKMDLSEIGSSYNVVKNTLFSLALKESKLPELETLQADPHAVIFVDEDIAAAAKMVSEFAKEHKDNVEIVTAILEGEAMTTEQAKGLADMPTMEQSIAMIAGILERPMADTAYVLQNSVQSIAIILDKAFQE